MSQPLAQPKVHGVVIAPYDPSWPKRAAELGARLAEALGGILVRVEHIGSTTVPGLAAKPIIDLMPVVSSLDDLDRDRARVEALGYAWHGEFGIEGRRFCSLSDSASVRLANLHFFEAGSPHAPRHVIFRDYLRAHPNVARKYEEEKRRIASIHAKDSRGYADEKGPWVVRADADALQWYATRNS